MKNNKNIISLGLVLLIGIIFFLVYQKYQELNYVKTDAIQAIPINAAVIIESDNWNTSLSKLENANIWQSIMTQTPWDSITKNINEIEQALRSYQELGHIFDKQALYLSIHHSTNNFYVLISTSCSKQEFDFLLSQDSLLNNISNRNYDGITIHKLSNSWNICHQKDILFFSNSELLIEDGVRQLNNQISLLDNDDFNIVRNTKSTFAGAHIYINYDHFSKLLEQISTINNSDIKWLNRWANWAELDLEISNNDLTFSGFTLVEDSSSNYLTSLFGQVEQKIEISKIAPRNTSKILALGINDPKLFYNNYKEFLAKHNNLYEHQKAIEDINSAYNIDIENSITGIIENEMGCISTSSNSGKTENYLFLKAKKESIEVINFLNKSISNSIFKENYRGYQISQFNLPNILFKLYGHLFQSVSNNYYCWIDDYLIFANSPTDLKAFINNFLSEKVLETSSNFINFKDKIGSRCNFLMYTNPSIGNWNKTINDKFYNFIKEENWSNIKGFVYQLSSKNELFYNNMVLHFENNVNDESQLDWIVDFDNSIISSPLIVYNHQSKKNNIIVQDSEKNVFLIDQKGNILWNKKIGGIILDQVSQIDFYKNGKLQYLFNTEDSLYLIDRLGRNVENYPMALFSKAKRGHTLLDYDQNRKYRILIPCQEGMVDNYSKEGKKIKGWKFNAMPNPITQQLKYSNILGKDYIYVVDSKGQTQIVGRDGKNRTSIEKIPLNNSFYINSDDGSIYSTDSIGNVWMTKLNGTSTKIKTSEIQSHYFLATNFNQDEFIDLFISDESNVECYNLESKTMSFAISADQPPKVFQNNNQYILGISSKGYCHLFSDQQKLITNKPLFGSGDFECIDLDYDNKLNLIILNDNILNNYSLE